MSQSFRCVAICLVHADAMWTDKDGGTHVGTIAAPMQLVSVSGVHSQWQRIERDRCGGEDREACHEGGNEDGCELHDVIVCR